MFPFACLLSGSSWFPHRQSRAIANGYSRAVALACTKEPQQYKCPLRRATHFLSTSHSKPSILVQPTLLASAPIPRCISPSSLPSSLCSSSPPRTSGTTRPPMRAVQVTWQHLSQGKLKLATFPPQLLLSRSALALLRRPLLLFIMDKEQALQSCHVLTVPLTR